MDLLSTSIQDVGVTSQLLGDTVVMTSLAAINKKEKKKSYIVADVPALGYGEHMQHHHQQKQHIMVDQRNNISQEVVVVTTEHNDVITAAAADYDVIKQETAEMEDGEGEGRRLNVSVTGGFSSGPRTVVLTVP